MNSPVKLQNANLDGLRSAVGPPWMWQFLFFCAACVIVISRRPDALLHPQFIAEDGAVWYAQAYNLGWLKGLLIPYAGYFQTLPRIVAGLATLVPLSQAPVLMNVFGIAAQALPVNLLVSSRCSTLGPLPFRRLLALSYLLLPNAREVHVSITNSQWHLALLACLILLASPASTTWWKLFDTTALLISGLTGPFCIALSVVALAAYWKRRRSNRSVTLVAVIALTAAIQILTLWRSGFVRSSGPLGATPALFAKIVAGHVYLGTILGQNRFAQTAPIAILFGTALLGTAAIVYCSLKASFGLKMALLFCFLVFAGSLKSPLWSGSTVPAWEALRQSPGMRYWFLPTLAFAWSLLWLWRHAKLQILNVLGGATLVLMCFGVLNEYRFTAFRDLNFSTYARAFQHAPKGSVVSIPINPKGWTVSLTKK